MKDWLLFACYQRGHGHLLYRPGMLTMYERPWAALNRFDGLLAPTESTPYVAAMTRLGPWDMTAISFWDYTADHRPGSNVILFAPSLLLPPDHVLAGGQVYFHEVWSRLPEIKWHHTVERFRI